MAADGLLDSFLEMAHQTGKISLHLFDRNSFVDRSHRSSRQSKFLVRRGSVVPCSALAPLGGCNPCMITLETGLTGKEGYVSALHESHGMIGGLEMCGCTSGRAHVIIPRQLCVFSSAWLMEYRRSSCMGEHRMLCSALFSTECVKVLAADAGQSKTEQRRAFLLLPLSLECPPLPLIGGRTSRRSGK